MASTEYEAVHAGGSLRLFHLREADGGQVSLWDYHGRRNLVLFFMHSAECSGCRKLLELISSAYDQLVAEEGEILVVVHAHLSDAAALKHEMGLRCPVLSDVSGEVFKQYGLLGSGKKPRAAIVVSDRFGEIYHVSISGEEHRLASVEDILSWLGFIEIQCPESGAPEWPK